MTDQVQSRQRGGAGSGQRMTKAERRAAAKAAAAARAAAAKRQRRTLRVALAGSAVFVVIIGIAIAFGESERTADAPAAAGATAAAPDSPARPAWLPPGADSALAKKPAASAGSREPSQLKVTPMIEGNGAATRAGQKITVNYVGVSYRTGEEFDASWNRGQPFSFQLGAGQVIQGWDLGLVGVKVGSRVQLDIPPELAYGDFTSGGRPAGALRFVVDVLAAQ